MPRKRIGEELRNVPLNLKVTQQHRDMLTAITKARKTGSDTQTVIQMIETEHEAILPKEGQGIA